MEKKSALLPRDGAFDLGLAVSVPLPIVTGIFVLLWFQSRLTPFIVKKLFVIFLFIADQAIIIFSHES